MGHIHVLQEKPESRPQRNGRKVPLGKLRVRTGSRLAIGDPAGFAVSLEHELGRMRRRGDSSCLLMVAVDTPVDAVALDLLGGRFANNLRNYDSLCRYGANRFLVLLPHLKGADVPGIIKRLRIQVAGYALTLVDGGEDFVTATMGCAMLDPDIGMQENIDRAASACRSARRQGGNRHQMWNPELEIA